jgi:hypothetical protein
MPKSSRVRWYGPQVIKKAQRNAERNLDKAAEVVRTDIVTKFPGGSAGNHASAGSLPHVQTGHLKRNINWARAGHLKRVVGTGIGSASSVGYAVALEFGSNRMAARPYLRPALKRKALGIKVSKIVGKKLI